MSAISLKSITGITSITTPSGVDNQLTLHNNNTTEAVKLDIAGNLHFHNHLNITGVSSASNFKTGSTNVHSTGVELANINTGGGTATFGGKISIGGTELISNSGTYLHIKTNANEDMAKFQKDGGSFLYFNNQLRLETKQNGIDVQGRVTASNGFYGDGSNLTGITQTTINNNANNRIITGSGTANTLEGESTLTYDGTSFMNTGGTIVAERGNIPSIESKNSTTSSYARVYLSQTSGSGGYFAINKLGTTSTATGGANATQLWASGDAPMLFATNNSEKLRITADGKVGINVTSPTTNLQIGDGTVDSDNVLRFGKRVSSNEGNLPLIGHHSHNGSASSLALSATSSSGCIHFFTGNDADGFGDGNNDERLRIHSNGIVSIGDDHSGAASLGADLNVVNVAGANMIVGDTVSGEYLEFIGTGGAVSLGSRSNHDLRFFTNGSTNERLRIDTVGRVMINQTTNLAGTAKLEVMGTGDNSYPQYSYAIGVCDTQDYNVSNGTGMGIGFSYKHNSAGATALGCGIRGFKENTTDGNYAGAMAFYTRANGAGAGERGRFSSAGTFGVGTANPDSNYKIDCNGKLRIGDGNAGHRIQFSRSGLGDELVLGVDGYGNSTTNEATIQSSINSPRPLVFATNNAERLRITSDGNIGMGVVGHDPLTKLHVQGSNNGGLRDVLTITNENGSSGTEVGMVFECGTDEIARISAKNEGSDTGPLIFSTASSQTANPTEKLRIHKTGGLQISSIGNVSAFTPNTSGITGGLILTTPVYSEYHYTWSGHSSYTIDLTCASYFHSEFIYVQHQTNGGSRMQQYVRGQWSNNHHQHSCKIWEDAGSGGGLSVSFVASDQSGGGAINGRTNQSSNGSTYSGFVNGGGESSSSTANGRLRISETYNWGSVSSRALIVRVYFGSFAISKS